MFLLDFSRHLRGYVRFTATGDFVERFLNLTARDHIAVWGGRKSGDTYTGCVDTKSYGRLRRHARKTGVRIRIAEKHGVPFTRYRYRHRYGILAGLAIFAVFLGIMSRFIWRIEVNGNTEMTESSIIQVLEGLDIRSGVLRSSIDVRDSERRALLLLHELSWVALNIEGSTVHVEVKERTEPPDMLDPGKPCNIIAAADGQILTLNAFDGQPLVNPGDTVRKGDIIVSGITQDLMGKSLFRHAQAEVIATIHYIIEAEVPLDSTEYVETGRSRHRSYLDVIGFQLPLFVPLQIPHPYHVEREQTPLLLMGVQLPFSLLREDYTLMEEVPVTLTKEQAKEMALRQLNAAQQLQLGAAQIHDKELTGNLTGESYQLRADYVCTMNIAEEREILLEDDISQN